MTPATPKKVVKDDFDHIIARISRRWDLQLDVIHPPASCNSPSRRWEAANTEEKKLASQCIGTVKFLFFKGGCDIALSKFEDAARRETSQWSYKPDAEAKTLPTGVVCPLSQRERIILLGLLENELRIQKDQTAETLKKSGPGRLNSDTTVQSASRKGVLERVIDDSPIPPIAFHNARKLKRSSDDSLKSSEFLQSNPQSKMSKSDADQGVLRKIDDVPVITRKTSKPSHKRSSRTLKKSPTNNVLPNYAAIKPEARRVSSGYSASTASTAATTFSSARKDPCGPNSSTSADTSFSSDIAQVSDIGKRTVQILESAHSRSRAAGPQTPRPTRARTTHPAPFCDAEPKMAPKDVDLPVYPDLKMSQYSQPGDFDMDDFPSTATLLTSTPLSALERLKARLEGVFPRLPKCLEKAPLGIRYEIVRVFQHAQASMSSLDLQKMPGFSCLQDYAILWQWLKNLPALDGKKFPSKSDTNAWEMSLGTFSRGFKRVAMSGTLCFVDSDQGPLFTFKLHPMKVDLSYRLGRRFGNDRFFEISMPILEDTGKLPKKPAQLLKAAGKPGRDVIIEWLHQESTHEFLGRRWGLFYVKERGRSKGKVIVDDDEDAKTLTTKRLCFFATSGLGFVKKKAKVAPRNEPINDRSEMTVEAMLNWLLFLQKNAHQGYLKFYSRISLGLSMTYATVVLPTGQIKKRKKDLCSKNKEVMNDGCGRMSNRLAMNVSTSLGLAYVPSAFQGRIGEAKGLWIVDYSTQGSDQGWIETYPSQRKWERTDGFFGLAEEYDEEQRTFEVIKWSGPLKSAALTLQFLPLLEDRGVPREAISQLLINGLTHEMGQMVAAVQDPQSFRKWIRDNHSGVSKRLKTGVVNFKAGMPESFEETLNMLLDAGFDPKKLGYARELARTAFRSRCDVLKEKLNIKVGLSTYAFIAVDFQGVLKPHEIHLSFSNTFRDEVSGQSMLELDGMDVLIARSPAHFVSDIQKVRAVFKPELMKYKDIVILPSTGDSPLAGLLSGGDYDGDQVWLCFDQDIAKNFQNAQTPQEPDLLEDLSGDGPFLKKNDTKFSQIIANGPNSFGQFLQRSFDFNFKLSYLGICTNYKEKLCYEQNNVGSVSAVYLSTLLSCLVDQCKQGYEFTDEDWGRLRGYLGKMRPKRNGNSSVHIKDYLKAVAQDQTEKTLQEYHESLPPAEYFDLDLVKCAEDFRVTSRSSAAHRGLLDQLERDVDAWKKEWIAELHPGGKALDEGNEDRPAFTKVLNTIYERWQDVGPFGEEWLKDSLLQKSWCHPDHSHWELLKASVLFSSYGKMGNFRAKGWRMASLPWYMACRQLCQLKTMANSCFNPVVPRMYAMLRPDSAFVRMIQSEKLYPRFREAHGELEQVGDDDEGSDDEDYD